MSIFEAIVGERIWKRMYGATAPGATLPPLDPDALRQRMGGFLFDFEAELRQGHVVIEDLPANDGGGAREVAGINMRYDGPEEAKLEALVKSGQYEEVRAEAIRYYVDETNFAESMAKHSATEFLARDIIFNRGQRGAVETFQHALGVEVDGQWGPASKSAMWAAEAAGVPALLKRITDGRRWYEETVVGTRSNFQAGLENRWARALEAAKTFL